jgi:nucleoid-associated protein YgaU
LRVIVWAGAAGLALAIVGAAVLLWRLTTPERPASVAAVPQITAPAPNPAAVPAAKTAAAKPPTSAPAPPSFDIVTVSPDGHAVIAGRAMPGDHITVLDGKTPIGEVTADARGEWVLLPQQPLAPGQRQLALVAVGSQGGPPRRSTDLVALSVAPAKAAGGTTTVAVLLPGKPGQPARILQASSPPSGETLTLDSVEYEEDGRLILSGHAAPGARLQIYAGDQPLGSTAADTAGRWQLAASRPSAAGSIELRLAEIGAGGGVARAINAPLAPPNGNRPPERGGYVVERGNSLWLIARRVYGHGLHYTEIYRANRGLIRNPDLIYPGQHFTLPKS